MSSGKNNKGNITNHIIAENLPVVQHVYEEYLTQEEIDFLSEKLAQSNLDGK